MPCKWCGRPIWWKTENGGYVPYEDKALTIRHDCPNKPTGTPPTQPPKQTVPALTDDEILWVRNLRANLRDIKK